ncbi:MAG: ATP-binding cassette domain-containing protein, partial [Pseudomonadota bacterium]
MEAAAALNPSNRSRMSVSDQVAIQITAMNKWYGQFHVLRDINLTVYEGERIVVCGPSGSGKSTLIRHRHPGAVRTRRVRPQCAARAVHR